MPTPPSFEEQIRAYNEELRRYYAQSRETFRAAAPKPEADRANTPAPEEAREKASPPAETDQDAKRPNEPHTKPETETETGSETETAERIAGDGRRDPGGDEPPTPVERPWEAIRAEEWMSRILRTQPGKAVWEAIASDESARQAPPFGYHPPQAVENGTGGGYVGDGSGGGAEQSVSSKSERNGSDGGGNDAGENSDTGFLQVRVFSARGAVPLAGAIVSIIGHNAAGQETLLHMERTDQSGIAPQVSLPTPDRALSLTPGDATPFLNYIVQVSAPGFATIRNERVALYGGVTSLQGVPMIPLPEPQSDYENAVVIRPGGAPPELN